MPTSMERKGLLPNGKVMDLITIRPGSFKDLACDIRCTNACLAEVERGNRMPKKVEAAEASEKEKVRKYKKECEKANLSFVPIVMETGGLYGKAANKLFNSAINKISSIYNIDSSAVDKFWSGRIAIALQTANANAFLIKSRKINYLQDSK